MFADLINRFMDMEKELVKEEIRKEFLIERMIVFSDAVFAIVITLMAIEIHIPELARFTSTEELTVELLKLLPTFIAYTASFAFIGFTWYQHLQVFSYLKNYDRGLVFRNLLLLFFIGLFPFSATLIARPSNNLLLPAVIYFLIIILCKAAQLNLHYYILIKRPQLRIHADIHEELKRFKKTRLASIMLIIAFSLVMTTMYLIPYPEMKPVAWWWFFLFPFVLKYFQKRIK